jgi:hypothetical protein
MVLNSSIINIPYESYTKEDTHKHKNSLSMYISSGCICFNCTTTSSVKGSFHGKPSNPKQSASTMITKHSKSKSVGGNSSYGNNLNFQGEINTCDNTAGQFSDNHFSSSFLILSCLKTFRHFLYLILTLQLGPS